ncbi:cytochrome P450 1A1 [Nematostella vectensis]|uniref:cytochrome P450 1A1 n=1 Tax=Nematostella vectensis TaxID=45351 RepID=UPI001390385F|nr:cytochrome P450 1A1 [Nematostella vectensis]
MSLIFRDFSPHFVSNKCAVEMSMRALLNDVETLNLRTSNALNSLLGKFESFSQNRTSLDPRGPALECISDFVMGHAFGNTISRCFFHEARAVLKESLSFIDIAFVGSCMDYVGFMRSINKNQIDKTVTDVTRLREFVTKVYNVHKSSMLQTSDYRTSLALRLRQLKDTIPEKQYSFAGLTTGDGLELDEEMIVSLLTDITFSAYEKISTALLWCIARLAESLPLQMELQDNLDQLGQEKLSLNDKPRYPLLDAFISETLRTSCIMPFGLPRRTVRETTICGINIPKDTTVLLNLWSCAYDPKVYKNPELFNPKRFLTEDVNGKTQIRCPSFPAFSAGHRRCLGDTLSRSVLFFLVGGMLQNYSMELEDESMKSNLEGKYALTLRPKRYKINLQKRIKNFDKRH